MMRLDLQKDYVSISFGKWAEVGLQVRDLAQWGVRALRIECNSSEKVVEEIAHIHFTALTLLSLGGNQIQSIQALSRVQMPHIRRLLLFDNKITSVGVMRKADWHTLHELSMRQNNFRDGKSLTLGCFPQMQQLQVYQSWGEKNTFTEQCFLAKMQVASLQASGILKNKFCFDRSIARVLQRRWPHIEIK